MKKMLLLLNALCFVMYAHAQYNVVKKSLIDIGLVNNTVSSMAVDSTGQIVVVGSVQEGSVYKLCFLRYKSNGLLDIKFSNDGIDTFSVKKILPAQYQGAYLSSVAIQPDGKIIAAGYAWYLSGVNYLSNVLMMRLNKNGSLDSSFGDNGTVRTNINSSTGLSVDEAHAVRLQQDGKIVIAGDTYDYIQYRFLAIRYNADGSPDNSFGSGGATLVTIGTSDDKAFALDIEKNGKLVLAGESYLSGGFSYRVAVVRLTATGQRDNNFGTNGIVTTNIAAGGDVAQALSIQANGKIIVGGFTQNVVSAQKDLLCIRYRSNGNVDSSFGANGKVIFDIANHDDAINNLIIQADDKILVSGYSEDSDNVNHFLSMRLLTDGTKDISYSNNGIQTTNFLQQDAAAYGMSLLNNGKILLAGQITNGAGKYVSVVRYKPNGKIDSAFANNGNVAIGIGSSEDVAYKMLRMPWQKNALLLAGTANGFWVVAKYNSNTLTLDSSFGLNGVVSVNYKNPNDPTDEPSLAIDAETREIYLAGYTGSGVTITRFNKDGTRDKNFGNNGVVNYDVSLYYGGFTVQQDHKILLAGVRQFSTSGYDFITRLKADGSVDSSFGNHGEVQHLPLTVTSVQMKNDGHHMLLVGRVPQSFNGNVGVFSMNLDGTVDSSFGTNGLSFKKASSAQIFFKYNLAQDQKGNILVSGGVQTAGYEPSVTKFLSDGVLDSSFAKNGFFVKTVAAGGFDDNYNEGISGYCVDNNCSVLTSGIKLNDGNEQSNVIVITLKDDGTIDSLNNSTGYIDTAFYNDKHEANYAALIDTVIGSKEIMFIAGKASNGNNSDFELIKISKPFISNTSEPLFISKIENDFYENRRSVFAIRN